LCKHDAAVPEPTEEHGTGVVVAAQVPFCLGLDVSAAFVMVPATRVG